SSDVCSSDLITAIIGAESGKIILKNNLKLEQPSIFADSSSSWGIVLRENTRAITIFQIAAARGKTSAQIVSIIPTCLTPKYVGINPPSKNTGKPKIAGEKLRPTRSFLPNVYAAGRVIAKLILVPNSV